ncbi:MAG: hypothetical protein ACP5HS_14425 [Anaerolineae bacterium]
MKARTWFGLGLAITLVMVGGVLLVGTLLWNHRAFGLALTNNPVGIAGPGCGNYGAVEGLADDEALLSEEVVFTRFQQALEAYSGDLEIAEIMEFERNYYAYLVDTETGDAVVELVLDKASGVVSPEMGPNMMWNRTYGMDRSMMVRNTRQLSSANSLSEQQALRIAQDWLDERDSGLHADEHAVSFPGYYTLHTLREDRIAGMLSVHAESGQVWYHTWHGEFVGMIHE